MAHFAQLDENFIVLGVYVIANREIKDAEGNESEELGIALCEELFGPGLYVQCSYNQNFRKLYPSPGFIYDPDLDEFTLPAE